MAALCEGGNEPSGSLKAISHNIARSGCYANKRNDSAVITTYRTSVRADKYRTPSRSTLEIATEANMQQDEYLIRADTIKGTMC
ncbi:hypothetical protein ANN_16164 [Periplaneta americana]|uniref:Uncharacterized protein n=1 Tax=Periplaneta americana TaxID=6978 RepID=A0ABQ8SJL1_PERAM|nr:hypothetical protein ANN_16164 [Periplaneta americana]